MLGAMILGNSVIRQMAIVMGHNRMQFITTMKDIRAMVAMCVQVTLASPIRIHDPDVSAPADKHDIAVRRRRDIGISWNRLVRFLYNDGRRLYNRNRCGLLRRQRPSDDLVELVRIDHKIALLVGRATRKHCRDGNTHDSKLCCLVHIL
jgi:hypothetical protein